MQNLLAANWRCQLATVKTEEEFSVTSTIVRYLAPRASPLTLLLSLDADAEHIRVRAPMPHMVISAAALSCVCSAHDLTTLHF